MNDVISISMSVHLFEIILTVVVVTIVRFCVIHVRNTVLQFLLPNKFL